MSHLLKGIHRFEVAISCDVAFHEGACLSLTHTVFCIVPICENLEMRSHYCYDIAWHGFPDTHCSGHLQHVSPTRNYKFVVESDNHDLNSICDWSHSDSASSRSS